MQTPCPEAPSISQQWPLPASLYPCVSASFTVPGSTTNGCLLHSGCEFQLQLGAVSGPPCWFLCCPPSLLSHFAPNPLPGRTQFMTPSFEPTRGTKCEPGPGLGAGGHRDGHENAALALAVPCRSHRREGAVPARSSSRRESREVRSVCTGLCEAAMTSKPQHFIPAASKGVGTRDQGQR